MATTKSSLFADIDNLVSLLNEKTASAPNPADPGGYKGKSSHPTANAENHGQNVMEGARSSENTSDIKADIGGQSVDSTSDLGADTQDAQQPNIGTNQSATGEDPSTEDDYKGGKDDPGSSHPARTDNDSLDGNKYASASFQQLHELHDTLANAVLADLANFGEQLMPKAAGTPTGKTTKAAAAAPTAITPTAVNDARAGYELAARRGHHRSRVARRCPRRVTARCGRATVPTETRRRFG